MPSVSVKGLPQMNRSELQVPTQVTVFYVSRKFYVPQNCSIMKCKHDLKGRVHNFLIKVFSIRVSKWDWRLPEKMLSILKKRKKEIKQLFCIRMKL